ncbi:MAG: glycosyltransferase [Bdellovibrionota bacterium]
MRILTITNLFPNSSDERNGIFLYRQLMGLQSEGAKIEVWLALPLCPWPLYLFRKWQDLGPAVRASEFAGGKVRIIRYLRLPGAWFNRWSGYFLYLACKGLLGDRRGDFDKLYGYDIFPSGDAAVRLGKKLNLPTMCSAIGVDLMQTSERNEGMRQHAARILKLADGIMTCGKALADRVYRYAQREALNIYGVVDLDLFRPTANQKAVRQQLHLPPLPPIGVFSGYLQTRKGVYDLLNALKQIRQKYPELIVVFCGEGPERKGLEEQAKAMNLERNVRFCGYVAPEKMAAWYQTADFFILPSHIEGMPNALMEAMACGLPAIASAVGGIPDAVGEGAGVLPHPPRSPEALAGAMERLLSGADQRTQFSQQARSTAERDFGLRQKFRLHPELLFTSSPPSESLKTTVPLTDKNLHSVICVWSNDR